MDTADIDPSQSSVECPSSIRLGEELVMTGTAVTQSGQAVTCQDDIMTSLQVKVTSSDNEAVACVTSPGDGGEKFNTRPRSLDNTGLPLNLVRAISAAVRPT